MPFIAKVDFSNNARPLIRAYMHEAGFADVFGTGETAIRDAAEYALAMWRKTETIRPDYTDYVFAALFGNHGDKMAELFGYYDFQETPTSHGNPTKGRWTYQNGIYVQPIEDGCEDTDILLAEEALWRRRVGTESFKRSGPPIRASILTPGNRYLGIVRNDKIELLKYPVDAE